MPRTPPRPTRTKPARKPSPPKERRSSSDLVGSPLERVWRLHARLARGERVNADRLAAEFEVSRSTIRRDIEFMRDRLFMPIEWDAAEGTYVYTRECAELPLLCLNEREALMLAVVGRVLASCGDSPLGRDLDAIVRKIAPVLGGAVAVAVDSVDRVLSLPEASAFRELRHFFPLLLSLLDRRPVQLHYAKPGLKPVERRLIHPLHLTHRQERWRLIAFDTGRRAVRQFVLERIQQATLLSGTFEPPAGFDAAKHLAGCMGAFAGDREQEVRIALDAHAAAYARERPWHASQTLHELPDGRTELRLRLTHLADVRHTVLGWGSHAEALAPQELRDDIRISVRTALVRYGAE